MTLHITLEHLIALCAGIAILVKPKWLNYIVAGYLIAVGVLGILGIRF
jgi:presenilin-like A22 family membrane protease